MDGAVDRALAVLDGAVETLLSAPLENLAALDVVEVVERLETVRRRADAVDARVLAEVEERRIAGDLGRTSVADLLSVRLRVGRGEARARVARARELGPRRAVIGEALAPLRAATATALANGMINSGHVAVIGETLRHLPTKIAAEAAGPAERFLLQAARHEEPGALRRTAQLLLARLDPDGQEPREELQQRRRGLSLHHCGDRVKVTGELTSEVAALWEAVFDSLAAPQPVKVDGKTVAEDDRSPAQRRHDAFGEAGKRLLNSGSLPVTGGTPVTVLVRCTPEQLVDPDALLPTARGRLLSMRQVLRIGGADTALIPVSFDAAGEVLWCGREERLANRAQRRAAAARDGGCTFPGCTRPAAWCEVHHVIAWLLGGLTDIDNLILLCGQHHRMLDHSDWQVRMNHGQPEWLPPPWLDPNQRPIRNTAHHLPEIEFRQEPGRMRITRSDQPADAGGADPP